FFHYPPLMKARELIADGAIGRPTVIRIKTVVANTSTTFQDNLEPEGYIWRFDSQSPGGHLFDDVVHKYATALWLVPERVNSVQAIVRRGLGGFFDPCKHNVGSLLTGAVSDMTGAMTIRVVQLCSAVYQASSTRAPVEPATIEGSASPPWWPKDADTLLEESMEIGRAQGR